MTNPKFKVSVTLDSDIYFYFKARAKNLRTNLSQEVNKALLKDMRR